LTIDLAGTALVIGAVCTGIGALLIPASTVYLQLKAAKKADAAAQLAEKNKNESIAARETQTQTIIASAVGPALNTPVPTPPDGDKV
jgi:hypothetical protein